MGCKATKLLFVYNSADRIIKTLLPLIFRYSHRDEKGITV